MQTGNFYNTTNETGQILENHEQTSKKQEMDMLDLFKEHIDLNPSRIIELRPMMHRTSISRALRNLTIDGQIDKTENKVMGKYGRREHIWRYNRPAPTQKTLF